MFTLVICTRFLDLHEHYLPLLDYLCGFQFVAIQIIYVSFVLQLVKLSEIVRKWDLFQLNPCYNLTSLGKETVPIMNSSLTKKSVNPYKQMLFKGSMEQTHI